MRLASLSLCLFSLSSLASAFPHAEDHIAAVHALNHAAHNRTHANAASNHTHTHTHNALDATCAKMRALTHLAALAANSTKLSATEAKKHLSTSEIAALQAKAANATAELATLQANATLVSQCAVVDAKAMLQAQCREMKNLEELAKLAGNTTALEVVEGRRNLTAAQAERLKEMAANATQRLKGLMGNETLVAACEADKGTANGSASTSGSAAGASSTATASSSAGATVGASLGSVSMLVGLVMCFGLLL